MNKIVPSGESVTLTTDGANVTCLNGEKGEPGAQGEMGPKGEKGESSINPYNVWGKNRFDRKIVSKLIKISYKINFVVLSYKKVYDKILHVTKLQKQTGLCSQVYFLASLILTSLYKKKIGLSK